MFVAPASSSLRRSARARRWRALVLATALIATVTQANADIRLRIVQRPVGLSEDARAVAEARVAAALEQEVSVSLPGSPRTLTWKDVGARGDVARLQRWIEEARDSESAMRAHAKKQGSRELSLRVPLRLDSERTVSALTTLAAHVDRPAVDARVDTEGGVLPEQEGRRLDVWATIDGLDDALRQGRTQVDAVIRRTPARRKASDLEGAKFDMLLGSFATPYNGMAQERTHNLRVAASKVDGLILLPGETFDFNDHVGERSLANGFRPATVIAGGELVDGVGGGACQIAGTLHAAVFFGGLAIGERHPHSRPSSYIKLGLDAAVAYPRLSFSFTNDRSFPIAVRLTVRGGFTRAEIWGAKRSQEVSFVRRVDEAIPFDEREISDPQMPSGVRVLVQRGVPGFAVSRWRILRDVGTNVSRRQRSEDRYPPTQQIWRVGTGGALPADYEPPTGDEHGEYTADEYTVMTQGPELEDTAIVRRAGRTGTAGWTKREGMPGIEAP